MHEVDPHRTIDALAQLKAARLDVFGADTHGFRLNPPLSEGEVVAFERKHRITLPNDYRLFLTCLGNGGAGPYYGVFPLGFADHNSDLSEWNEGDGLVGVLSEPFTFENEWNDLSTMPPDDLADQNLSEYDRQMEIFDGVYYRPSLTNGAMPICHEGCALRIYLVVTGKQAGHLWEDRRSEQGGLKPLRLADGNPATFIGWYDEWLNDSMARL